MTGPDRLIEASLRTVVGRWLWLIASLAVIYVCVYLLAAIIGGVS